MCTYVIPANEMRRESLLQNDSGQAGMTDKDDLLNLYTNFKYVAPQNSIPLRAFTPFSKGCFIIFISVT